MGSLYLAASSFRPTFTYTWKICLWGRGAQSSLRHFSLNDLLLTVRERYINPSITHKFDSYDDAQLNIS
jgi:hypothetical protein